MGVTQLVRGGGEILLLSMRRIEQLVAFCVHYEFEDVIAQMTSADRVDVGSPIALEWSRRFYKFTRLPRGAKRGSGSFAGWHSQIRLDRDYELFFPVFNQPFELFALAAIPGWRKHCRLAACFLSEMWLSPLPQYLLELLASFDHIFVGVRHPIEELRRIVGRPCTYLPLAADVLRFAPYPVAPGRAIDLCNIGRRSQVTHDALLHRAAAGDFFYYYDTVAASGVDMRHRTFRVQDPREHRLLLASLLRHSRYCFAHRGYVNDPHYTNHRAELSSRVYEGAAAGVVMLGEPPPTQDFARQFDWPDAVIPVPFDCPDILRVLDQLDADPQRLARIRRQNVRNAALRHDWIHRLGCVFESLGLKSTERMAERDRLLRAVAEAFPGEH